MAFEFLGHGANVVGSLGSGSLVQNMPSAMQLNGTNAYASGSTTMSTVTGTTATIAMWVYYTGSQTNQGEKVLFSDSSSETRKILMQTRNYSSHGASFRYGYVDSAGGGLAAKDIGGSAGVLTSGTWQHFAIVADGNNVSLHVDGVQYSDATYQTAGTNSYAIADPHLGRAAFSDGRYFPGYIRDVQAYNVSSSTAQLGQIMNGELPHGTPIHWWTCDDGATNDDGSATDSDLTLTNTVEDKSKYELNQIGAGSVSGSVTVSGGTWNLLNSTHTALNGTSGRYDLGDSSNIVTGTTVTYATWLRCTDGATNTAYVIANQKASGSTNISLTVNRDDTGTGAAGQVSGFLWNGSTHVFAAYDAGINDGEWHQIVYTTTGSSQVLYLDGVQVATGTGAFSNAASTDDMTIGAFNDGTSDFFSGDISEVIIDDVAWTAAQVELNYKAQWVGSPAHWYKFNEGTGNAMDSGRGDATATQSLATWVNPDFTGDGPQLKAGTTMSAPRGTYNLASFTGTSPERDWNQSATSTFIHNSGTVTFSSGDTGIYNSTTAGPFYNILNDVSNTFNMRPSSKTIVENSYFYTAGYWVMSNNASLQMGTTSSAGTISGNSVGRYTYMIGGGDTTMLISGASTVYPSIWKGTIPTDTYWRGYWANSAGTATFKFKNLDIQDTVTLGSGTNTAGHNRATNFLLEGDTEFDAVTIGAGCEFDLNGQRAEFSDYVTYTGTLNASGLSVFHGGFTKYGTLNNAASGDIIALNDTGLATFSYIGGYRTFFQNGGVQLGTGGFTNVGKAIVAGTTNVGTRDTSSTDLSIPVGGVFQAEAKTHTVSGNFNMAGGFIGRGALDLNGVDEQVSGSTTYVTTGATSCCIEGWVNPTAFTAGNHYIWREGDFFAGFIDDTPDKWYVGWELEDAAGNRDYPGIQYQDATLLDGKWHHFAMTWASGTSLLTSGNQDLNFYVDGKKVAEDYSNTSANVPATVVRPRGTGRNWKMGNSHSGGGETHWYNGKIGRVSVWYDLPLTEAQIRQMMFYDWADVSGSSIDQTKCVQWYEFSDDQGATSISDMSGSGNTGTMLPDGGGWAGPGTFTYGASTLKFDKAGDCDLTGQQDGNATNMYSVHITSGTTVTANCRSNDLIMNSGSLMTNSGTLLSNRNWQYKSRNMPIVGPNSDLKVSTNIWYYMSDGSGLPASGAGTDYYQLRPGTNVYMQGDFDCQNGLLQSGGDLHLNGYACSTTKIWNYGGGNIHADPGSSIVFDTEYGFNTSYGENPTDMFFVASGEACAIFPGEYGGPQDEIDLPAGVLESLPQSTCSISMWVNIKDDDNNPYEGFFGSAVGKQFTMWRQQTGRLMFSIGGPAEQFSIFPSITSGVWYHIGMTYDGATVKGYFDGTQTGSRSYAGSWTTGESTIGAYQVGGSNSFDGKIADVRIFPTTLSDANFATLASENPATSVSGAYADPTNSLGAISWYKLGATPSGTLDASNFGTSGATFDGSIDGIVKSGFVTISGSVTPYNPINNLYPAGVTLKNVYISGSKDIVAGQRKENSAGFLPVASQLIKTEGTVVLD